MIGPWRGGKNSDWSLRDFVDLVTWWVPFSDQRPSPPRKACQNAPSVSSAIVSLRHVVLLKY